MGKSTMDGMGKATIGKLANGFDAQTFLDSAGLAKRIVDYRRNEVIFTQGDLARASSTSRRAASSCRSSPRPARKR